MQYRPLSKRCLNVIFGCFDLNNVHVVSRASISQDYRGDIKSLEVWGTNPQKLKLFVKLHIIFALKYDK